MTTQNNDDLFESIFGNTEEGCNERTDYFSQADGAMNKALACLDSLKSIAFVAAPDWPVRDELVRHLLALVIEYPWPDLHPQRMDGALYAFTQRNNWRLAILYAVPCYLAESAPLEAMIDGEIDEQREFIGNIAKEIIDIAGNLSFVYGNLHTEKNS